MLCKLIISNIYVWIGKMSLQYFTLLLQELSELRSSIHASVIYIYIIGVNIIIIIGRVIWFPVFRDMHTDLFLHKLRWTLRNIFDPFLLSCHTQIIETTQLFFITKFSRPVVILRLGKAEYSYCESSQYTTFKLEFSRSIENTRSVARSQIRWHSV